MMHVKRRQKMYLDGKKFYLAPMEGITTYVYRNAHAAVYGPVDKYFTPFLEPHEKRSIKTRELLEILPEHNEGLCVVPQILTNRSEGFLQLADSLSQYGYREINLNLGCPSRTVTSKKKGSGFLAYPEELDRFLSEVFEGLPPQLRVSVKTRLGSEEPEEFEELLRVFNRYPLEELIVHARLRKDFYGGEPRLESFRTACRESRAPLVYNGDLFTPRHIIDFEKEFPDTKRLMLGRGLLVNPGICAKKTGTQKEEKERFRSFHRRVLNGYLEKDMGGKNVLFKMKELWFYQIHLFEDAGKYAKKLKKTQKLAEYEEIVEELLETAEMRTPGERKNP